MLPAIAAKRYCRPGNRDWLFQAAVFHLWLIGRRGLGTRIKKGQFLKILGFSDPALGKRLGEPGQRKHPVEFGFIYFPSVIADRTNQPGLFGIGDHRDEKQGEPGGNAFEDPKILILTIVAQALDGWPVILDPLPPPSKNNPHNLFPPNPKEHAPLPADPDSLSFACQSQFPACHCPLGLWDQSIGPFRPVLGI